MQWAEEHIAKRIYVDSIENWPSRLTLKLSIVRLGYWTYCARSDLFFFGGGGRVGGFRMCLLPTTSLDFQSKFLNFCHSTLLKTRFKVTVIPQKRKGQSQN